MFRVTIPAEVVCGWLAACSVYHLHLKIEAVLSSTTSVNFYQATWCQINKRQVLFGDYLIPIARTREKAN
jgi:hypothetical protein